MANVIAIVGTLDTKKIEANYLRNEIAKFRHATILIDVSLRRHPSVETADVSNEKVAESAGSSIDLVAAMEKGDAIQLMTSGASKIVQNLWNEGKLNGIIGYGGSVGLALASSIMKSLPMGVPKLIVTTVAASAGKYIGAKDIVIFPSVTDLAGGENINRIEAVTLAKAAGAISGMVEAEPTLPEERPLVVASQFGVTTPHVQEAKKSLEERGYEVIAFHAVGTGGQSLEELVRSGAVAGVLDVTTHELADELVGGVCRAGPERLEAAGEKGIPQVILPGALDMVNFFEPETVPKQFETRRFYYHNPKVTLMRTTLDECVKLGTIIASKINKSKGPTIVVLPMKGWSEYDKEGGVNTMDYYGNATGQTWYDAEADAGFVEALEDHTDGSKSNIEIIRVDCHINDMRVARLSASLLDDMIRGIWTKGKRYD